MTKAFFVTGTDTDVGKTYVSQLLLGAFNQNGLQTAGFKPVSAGCEATPTGLRNQDALILQDTSSLTLPYELVNPIAFAPPVAPHLAAQQLGQQIEFDVLQQAYLAITEQQPDVLLVEGAGGWRLPIGQGRYLSDFAIKNQMPVILVVGMRLGCLNHALLTAEAIRADGLNIAGWVANHIDSNMALRGENIDSLKQLIDAPLLGEVPFDDKSNVASYFDLSALSASLHQIAAASSAP